MDPSEHRERPRRPRQAGAGSMPTAREKSHADRLQGTNDSSIVSKRSMERQGYFDDGFLRHFVAKTARRSPLINRGYYIRAKVVNELLLRFVDACVAPSSRTTACQFISLGCGFDTSFFRMRRARPDTAFRFVEIDLPDVIARKTSVIVASPELRGLVGDDAAVTSGSLESRAHGPRLVSRRYANAVADLQDTASLDAVLAALGLDSAVPTLLLSECVLTYVDNRFSDTVIAWAAGRFASAVFVLYEQIHPETPFGVFMARHFRKLGSPLRTIDARPTMASQAERFRRAGWANASAMDMRQFFALLGPDEWRRVDALEDFDEHEEWHLKALHYFVLAAVNDAGSAGLSRVTADFAPLSPVERVPDMPEDTPAAAAARALAPSLRWSSGACAGDAARDKRYGRWGHSACVVRGADGGRSRVVVFGGFGGGAGSNPSASGSDAGQSHARLSDAHVMECGTRRWAVLSPTGAPPSPRMFHAAAPVAGGEGVLVVGGRASPRQPLADCHVLWVAGDARWERVSFSEGVDACLARYRHTATGVAGGAVVVLFGRGGDGAARRDGAVISRDGNSWSLSALLPTEGDGWPGARHSHSAVASADGRRVVVYGGLCGDGMSALGDLWVYDVASRTWARVDVRNARGEGLPARYSHTAFLVDTRDGDAMVVFGGVDPGSVVPWEQTALLVDLASMTWSFLPLPSSPAVQTGLLQCKVVAAVADGTAHLVGGGGNCFSFGTFINAMATSLSWRESSEGAAEESATDEADAQPENKAPPVALAPPVRASPDDELAVSVPRSLLFSEPFEVARVQASAVRNFEAEFCAARMPVVVEDCAFGASVERWTPSYVAERCGHRAVSVHVAREPTMDFVRKNFVFAEMPFGELVREVFADAQAARAAEGEERRYLYFRTVGENVRRDPSDVWQSLPEMAADFSLPAWLGVDMAARYFSSCARVSSPGIRMWTHYDVMDNVLCQVRGTKRVSLWRPSDCDRMYLEGSVSPVVDVDDAGAANDAAWPRFALAQRVDVLLRPGDMLFIPALWLHNVVALEPSISVNVFWRNLAREEYEKKDLYGSRDLVAGAQCMAQATAMAASLQRLPREYRDFYARRAVEILRAECVDGPLPPR